MTEWAGLDLVPSPDWQGGPRRVGLALGPAGLWLAALDPDPDRPRLVTLLDQPLESDIARYGDSEGDVANLLQRANQDLSQALLALGGGVITDLQDLPPLPVAELVPTLLKNGLAKHAVWEGDPPVLTVLPVRESPTRMRALYAGVAQRTVLAWRQVLADHEVVMPGIEPLPVAALRGLIALGDVTPTGRWGLAVISQGRLWISLWDHQELLVWRDSPAPKGACPPGGAAPQPEALLAVVQTIKAAWRYGGDDVTARLWVIGDEPDSAEAVAQTLADDGVPARVPLHALLGPLARGGTTALAALGAAAAGVLPFPQVLSLDVPAPKPRVTRRGALAAAAVLVACLGMGLTGHVVVRHRQATLAAERLQLAQTLHDLQSSSPETQQAAMAALSPGWPLEQVLDSVRRSIPQDSWLTDLEVTESGQMTLQGASLAMRSPLLFSWSLDQASGWRRVRLSRLIDEGGIFAFTLQAMIDRHLMGAAPLGAP